MQNKNPHIIALQKEALRKNAKISLPEINDKRVVEAKSVLVDLGFNIVENNNLMDKYDIYKKNILQKKFSKNWTDNMISKYLENDYVLSLFALDNNDIDTVVFGASTMTADVLRSAIRIVGVNNDAKWISSVFFMISPQNNNIFTFADCAVIPDPNYEQLCSIAYQASLTHKMLTKEEPKVAFLSFSTKGSAAHYKIKKIKRAVKLFSKKYPEIKHDGEMQFDAAIDSQVAKKKNKDSLLNGDANVFIFPDLDSGNIAYKITQYLASYQALGPLLQGLKKPVHDLSRGCTVEDIVYISMIGALQVV